MSKLDKTFITYPGGSGGDLLGATCNGIELNYDSFYHTEHGIGYLRVPPYTIKKSDRFVQRGLIELTDVADAVPYQYLTTHLIDELVDYPVYNVVIDNPDSVLDIVYRRLILQIHYIDNDGNALVKLLTKLCSEKKYQQAADVFLHFYTRETQELNQKRQTTPYKHAVHLDFSDVFQPGFVPANLAEQHRELFRYNHNVWMQVQRPVTLTELKQRLMKTVPECVEQLIK